VTYLARIALPPDAVVYLTLEDVSDAQAVVVATQTIPTRGRQVPIPFELPYDPAKIDPSRRYEVRAQIRSGPGGEPMFASTTSTPVLTQGAPASADLMLQSVGGGTAAGEGTAGATPASTTRGASTAELFDTHWKIVSIDGDDVAATPGMEEPHLILKSKDNALVGSTGINRIVGSYELPGGSGITLRPLALTMMAGPEPMMKQEQRILQRLHEIDGYRLEGQRLTLAASGHDVMALRAVYPK
jgi:putative lipoprotein